MDDLTPEDRERIKRDVMARIGMPGIYDALGDHNHTLQAAVEAQHLDEELERIIGRGGRSIRVTPSPGYDQMDAALNGLAAEPDPSPQFAAQLAAWKRDAELVRGLLMFSGAILALTVAALIGSLL